VLHLCADNLAHLAQRLHELDVALNVERTEFRELLVQVRTDESQHAEVGSGLGTVELRLGSHKRQGEVRTRFQVVHVDNQACGDAEARVRPISSYRFTARELGDQGPGVVSGLDRADAEAQLPRKTGL
jgi:hypothetical protein